ncbi:hypothetical protein LBMAG41_10560 [Cyanobium sp.]|nr:hypothetical protein LBMAG41_10560 [Cyanobium sp.]
MSNSLSPEDLAWLRQCNRLVRCYAQAVEDALKVGHGINGAAAAGRRAIHDLGRQYGAAQSPDALPAVPVAWGNFREDGTCVGLTDRFEDTTRWLNPRPLFLSFRLPVAQPATPAGGLGERVAELREIFEQLIRCSRSYDGYSTMTPVELADRLIDAVLKLEADR